MNFGVMRLKVKFGRLQVQRRLSYSWKCGQRADIWEDVHVAMIYGCHLVFAEDSAGSREDRSGEFPAGNFLLSLFIKSKVWKFLATQVYFVTE